MDEKPDTSGKEDGGQALQSKAVTTRRSPWKWLVNNVQRVMHNLRTKREERYAKRKNETIEQRAARITAEATHKIAIYTVVMALVAIFTLVELYRGGADTKALVEASKKQADAAQKQACAAQHNADAAQQFSNTAGLINRNIHDAVGKLNTQAKATQNLIRPADILAQGQQEQSAISSGDPIVTFDWVQLCRSAHMHTVFVDVIVKTIGPNKADIMIAVELHFRKPTPKNLLKIPPSRLACCGFDLSSA